MCVNHLFLSLSKHRLQRKIRPLTPSFISFTFSKFRTRQSNIIAVPLASLSNCVELDMIISFDDDHGKSKGGKRYLSACFSNLSLLREGSKCQHWEQICSVLWRDSTNHLDWKYSPVCWLLWKAAAHFVKKWKLNGWKTFMLIWFNDN